MHQQLTYDVIAVYTVQYVFIVTYMPLIIYCRSLSKLLHDSECDVLTQGEAEMNTSLSPYWPYIEIKRECLISQKVRFILELVSCSHYLLSLAGP